MRQFRIYQYAFCFVYWYGLIFFSNGILLREFQAAAVEHVSI